jgi:hypothetical protein
MPRLSVSGFATEPGWLLVQYRSLCGPEHVTLGALGVRRERMALSRESERLVKRHRRDQLIGVSADRGATGLRRGGGGPTRSGGGGRLASARR